MFTSANILLFEKVQSWSVRDVKAYLESRKDYFSLNYTEIRKFEENGINGKAFLRHTEDSLIRYDLSTIQLISNSPTGLVFVFVDNSNFFIEGRFTIVLETLNRNWKVEIWFWTS
ncbi:1368_t:CDS:2, partial [Funneliformis geosporum]